MALFYRSLFFALFIIGLVSSCTSQELPKKEELMKDLSYLASDKLAGREADTPGNKMAREYITERFKQLGIKKIGDSYLSSFNFKTKKGDKNGVNIIGKVNGKQSNPIIITAHYDHEGIKNGKVYNGADDNASGIAGLLAMAKYFSNNQPNHTIVFVAFDAEEKGLQGSKYFVENLPFDKKDVMININMDMISRSDKNEIYAAGTYHYPQFKSLLEEAGNASQIKLSLGHDSPDLGYNDWTLSSDHGPFHKKGIPFIYFGVEDHPDYHQPTDDVEKVKPEFLEGTANLILDVVIRLDQMN